MRSQFDEQLAQLHRELIEMGALCEEVIALSSQALTEGDAALARRVAPLDRGDRPQGAGHREPVPAAAAAAAAGGAATCGRSPPR